MILSEEDLARIKSIESGDFYFVADDGHYQLRTQEIETAKGKPCYFLKDNLCSIFDNRPEGCRLYPGFWDGAHVGLDDDYCPHTDDFQLPMATKDAVRRLWAKLETEREGRVGP